MQHVIHLRRLAVWRMAIGPRRAMLAVLLGIILADRLGFNSATFTWAAVVILPAILIVLVVYIFVRPPISDRVS
jgi:amino acid transporter